MEWIWIFVFYSFVGFLLEVGFAYLTGGRADRKCLLLLPLCPVYGLGAGCILWLAPLAGRNAILLFFLGGAAATAVEYALAVWYEKILGVSFWDYREIPGNIQGRVCLPFSAAWGLLSLALVYWLHPRVTAWLGAVPVPVTLSAMVLVTADLFVSSVMMKHTGDRSCLQWYRMSGA